jgi:hypothetical protein
MCMCVCVCVCLCVCVCVCVCAQVCSVSHAFLGSMLRAGAPTAGGWRRLVGGPAGRRDWHLSRELCRGSCPKTAGARPHRHTDTHSHCLCVYVRICVHVNVCACVGMCGRVGRQVVPETEGAADATVAAAGGADPYTTGTDDWASGACRCSSASVQCGLISACACVYACWGLVLSWSVRAQRAGTQ